MSVVAPSRRVVKARVSRKRRPVSIVVLSMLLGILGIGTFAAARAMITNPLEPLGMTTEWLEKSPVDTYFWPGMFFLGMTLAILITLAASYSAGRGNGPEALSPASDIAGPGSGRCRPE